jgi:hypothetical protein
MRGKRIAENLRDPLFHRGWRLIWPQIARLLCGVAQSWLCSDCKRKGSNMRTLVTCMALLGLVGLAATPAQADRLTRQEKSSLRSAMKDAQCSGGRMENKNGSFEIDNARCQDGKRYDLSFDQNFKLTNKEQESVRGGRGHYGSGRNMRDNGRSNTY